MSTFEANSMPGPQPASWETSLLEATSEKEVLLVVRDFVARLDPAELPALPEECRPGKFFDADDVSGYLVDLIRHHARAEQSSDTVLALIAFFSAAQRRLAYLSASAND